MARNLKSRHKASRRFDENVSDTLKESRKKNPPGVHDPKKIEHKTQEDVQRTVPVVNDVQETDTAEQIQRTTSDKNPKDIAAWYRGTKGKTGDIKTIDRKDPNRKKKIIALVVVIVVFLAGISLGGFYFFMNQENTFDGKAITLDVDIPAVVASGDEITIEVSVENGESIDLKSVELTLQFPSGFTITSSVPPSINEAQNAWQLGAIKHGTTAKLRLKGKVLGEIGSTKNFGATISYIPTNFNSEFQKRDSFTLTISDSIFDLDVSVPVTIVSGQSSAYSITITNDSHESIDRVRLRVTVPEDLELSDLNSEPMENSETEWDVGTLEGGVSYKLTFNGTLSAEEGEMREIKTVVGYFDDEGKFQQQLEETSVLSVINPRLLIDLALDQDTKDTVASFGDVLEYVLVYRNESQSIIENMEMSIILVSDVLDWDSIADAHDGVISDNTITWDATLIEGLGRVEPGDSGEIAFSIKVKSNMVAQKNTDGNYNIVASALATSEDVIDLNGGTLEVESNSIITKINSKLDLRAEGRYYNDEYLPVGDGPIPPEAGETTSYRVYWYLQNNANEISDVAVTATLPDEVAWEDDISITAGTLEYDKENKKILWSINRVPALVGQQIPELMAWFTISVTPAASDVGTLLILLGKSEVSGYDTFTEKNATDTEDLITSNLDSDPLATDNGLVVKKSSTYNSNANLNTNSNTNTTFNTNSE